MSFGGLNGLPAELRVRAVCNDARRPPILLPTRCGRPQILCVICKQFIENGFRISGHPRTSACSSFYAGRSIFTLLPVTVP